MQYIINVKSLNNQIDYIKDNILEDAENESYTDNSYNRYVYISDLRRIVEYYLDDLKDEVEGKTYEA